MVLRPKCLQMIFPQMDLPPNALSLLRFVRSASRKRAWVCF
jgi:hypothetical protein